MLSLHRLRSRWPLQHHQDQSTSVRRQRNVTQRVRTEIQFIEFVLRRDGRHVERRRLHRVGLRQESQAISYHTGGQRLFAQQCVLM